MAATSSLGSGPSRGWSALATVREMYGGDTRRAHLFRYALLGFDVATLAFIVISSFLPRSGLIAAADVVIGVTITIDFAARLLASENRPRQLARPTTWADLAAIASFLTPTLGENVGFLRALRTLRLLRTYQVLDRLRCDSVVFARHEELILAVFNLAVFVFIVTGLVYETQHRTNPDIGNYVDALYFTITSLTTTGYGDVTLKGIGGRLISIGIMLLGVTLFLRLAQVLFRPTKIHAPCATCGLQRHEADALHCKACGTRLITPATLRA